jgi:hypothetical protein
MELGRLKALRPEVTTVYLGWNGFFNEEQVFGFPTFATVRLIRGVRASVDHAGSKSSGGGVGGVHKAQAPRSIRSRSDQPRWLRAGLFSRDSADRSRNAFDRQSRILFTLPGLYEVDRPPTENMLRTGHLPTYTDNPYVLAKLSARLNELLRQLAADESIDLIDLELWGRTALNPRERYFFDSVHLTDEGQAMLGRYIADRFPKILASH